MSSGPRTQTTSVKNDPPEFLIPYLRGGVEELTEIRDRGTPQYFPDSTIAAFTPTQRQALTLQSQRALNGSPVTSAAQDQIAATARGDYLDLEKDPSFKSALDYAMQPAIENFNEAVMPSLQSSYSAAGRYGSGSMDGAVDRAQRTFGREIAGMSARAASERYNAERGRMLSAGALAPQMAALDYADIDALGRAGTQEQAQNQAEIDARIARHNYGQTADFDYLREYLAAIQGAYPGGQSMSSYTPPRQPAWQAAAQGGMTGASNGAMFGPWGALIGGGIGAGMGLLSR